jgi:hypothetical protein
LDASVADNKMIIERYHELYKVEQAFRISKNDLQTRPIFHFKEATYKTAYIDLLYGSRRIKAYRTKNRRFDKKIYRRIKKNR